MHQDEEIHAQLLAEFRVYFAENQKWLSEGTKASAIRLRQSLSEIRRICSQRRVAIREWSIEKEEELRQKEAARQAHKRQAPGDDSAN